MAPEDIRQKNLLPAGFLPLPHVKQATGGQVFPDEQINEIQKQEQRNLRRFDVDFDLPDQFTPEFPAPIFSTTHPELGDVSGGQLLTIKNYYALIVGILTPVQIESLRLLLTPFRKKSSTKRKIERVRIRASASPVSIATKTFTQMPRFI